MHRTESICLGSIERQTKSNEAYEMKDEEQNTTMKKEKKKSTQTIYNAILHYKQLKFIFHAWEYLSTALE